MEKENRPHGRVAAGDTTVREGRHGAGAVPPCWGTVPTHSLCQDRRDQCGRRKGELI